MLPYVLLLYAGCSECITFMFMSLFPDKVLKLNTKYSAEYVHCFCASFSHSLLVSYSAASITILFLSCHSRTLQAVLETIFP